MLRVGKLWAGRRAVSKCGPSIRRYAEGSAPRKGEGKVVDFRSDTFTCPPPEMREAMVAAEVGDDVYGEDPTVNRLEGRVADMYGKESALFVPSGTMGNLICVILHGRAKMSELIAGRLSHIHLCEGGGYGAWAGVALRQAENAADGSIPLDLVRDLHRPIDPHFPLTKALCLENTQGFLGGVCLPLDYVKEARSLCDDLGIALHCDGARFWNASVAQGRSLAELAAPYHTISACLSKGMGCPVGTVIIGDKSFIDQARHVRKSLGGGWRQAGILGAAALWSLDHVFPKLEQDHANIRLLADLLQREVGFVPVHDVQTNILMFDIAPALPGVPNSDFVAAAAEEGVLLYGADWHSKTACRVVTYHTITEEDIRTAAKGLQTAAEKCRARAQS